MIRLDWPEWQHPQTSVLLNECGPLRAALLTTYEPPDPDLLIEDCLPQWLKIERDYAESGMERATFLAELQQRIKQLRGKITIFASGAAIKPHWLWRDVHICQVGSTGHAVQHAKLWLLLRGPGPGTDESTLELVVGSANLTKSALHKQIQAGWRAVVRLGSASQRNMQSWGILPRFLEELGRQSGQKGRSAIRFWIEKVLPRAMSPAVSFFASVPGRHAGTVLRRAESAWGIAGFRYLRPVARTRRIKVIAPSIGIFDTKNLKQWADRAGTSTERLTLVWIPEGHPWSGQGWTMPPQTAAVLRKSGIQVLAFPTPDDKEIEHYHQDWDCTWGRWFHGKLYWIQDAHRRRLLVTSANWSHAAWGRPLPRNGLSIENFELGVAFDSQWQPLEFSEPLDGDLATEPPEKRPPKSAIAWSEALWDGKAIRLAARLSSSEVKLLSTAEIVTRNITFSKPARWRHEGRLRYGARVDWPLARGIPASAIIGIVGDKPEKVEVVVSDMRLRTVDTDEEFAEMDPVISAMLELRLLEERYGGASADTPPAMPEAAPGSEVVGGISPNDGKVGSEADGEIEPVSGAPPANYEVPAITIAREKLDIVTHWAKALAATAEDDEEGYRAIMEDGRCLVKLWSLEMASADSAVGLALRVAMDELAARLGDCS